MSNFFAAASKQASCSGHQAVQKLRKAIARGGDRHADEDANENDDSDLLPTLPGIRRAFESGSEQKEIAQLLACRCPLCSPSGNNLLDEVRHSMADKIWHSEERLKSFSVLILAGCLFAVREVDRYSKEEDLKLYCERLKPDSDQGPRRRRLLFRDIPARLKPVGGDQNDRELKAAAEFCCAVESKLKLYNIRTLYKLEESKEFPEYTGAQNLPFILRTEVQRKPEGKPNVRFWKCQVESSYAKDLPEVLFRKRSVFQRDEREPIRAALKEAKMAVDFRGLGEPSIANIVLAFKETLDDFVYVNLVFQYCEMNLNDILLGKWHETLSNSHSRTSPTLGNHKLWRLLLGVVEAIAKIHSTAASSSNNELEGIKGHFDIHPANILVDGEALLLTDFGQAAIYKPGAEPWAPPERPEKDERINPELSTHYDTWSLACVLLEVMVYILHSSQSGNGSAAVEAFRTGRYNEVLEPSKMASFWKVKSDGNKNGKVLRDSVQSEIDKLEESDDPYVQRVLKKIKSMLNVTATRRPVVKSCLHAFLPGVGREVFELPGQEPRGQWSTSFQTHKMREPLPCELFIYELPQSRKIVALLEYRQSGVYAIRYDGLRSKVDIVPTTLFHPRQGLETGITPRQWREKAVYECRFVNLLEGVTLHFHQADHFFDFMVTVMDQGLESLDDEWKGMRVRFKTCVVTQPRPLPRKNKKTHIEDGNVQIWRRQPPPNWRPAEHIVDYNKLSRRKMIIFGKERESSDYICLIVDIGTKTFDVKTHAQSRNPSSEHSNEMVFRESNGGPFRGLFYRPVPSLDDVPTQNYPGIPISLERIDKEMDVQKNDKDTRIAELRLRMAGSREFEDFDKVWHPTAG